MYNWATLLYSRNETLWRLIILPSKTSSKSYFWRWWLNGKWTPTLMPMVKPLAISLPWGRSLHPFITCPSCSPGSQYPDCSGFQGCRDAGMSGCPTAHWNGVCSLTPSFFFIFNWSIIALLCCVSFCCITTSISYKHTYIPSFLSLPPTQPSPLGHHRAPSWVPCVKEQLLW